MRHLKSLLGSTFVLLAVSLLPASASAQDPATAPAPAAEESSSAGSFSANVSLTTEYFFRGITQTQDAPALQGGFDYEVSLGGPVNLYLGTWASNVDFNESDVDGATIEIDWYGGLNGNFGESATSWDVGFIYYSYPGDDSSLDSYDFLELQAALGHDFGAAAITASVNYSADNFGESGTGVYPKLALDVPIPAVKGLSLSAYVAKQFIDKEEVFGAPDYVEWNVAATVSAGGFDFTGAYIDTDLTPAPGGKSESFTLTVGRSF